MKKNGKSDNPMEKSSIPFNSSAAAPEKSLNQQWQSFQKESISQLRADTCIVVPCYNEADRLVLDPYKQFFKQEASQGIVFLFVDDGSTDETEKILSSWKELFPEKCSMFRLKKNSGKAEAVRQGVLMALQNPDFCRIGYWDADLSTPLEDIVSFREILRTHPELLLLMGNRNKRLGCAVERSMMRHYTGRLAATLISLKLNLPVYDTQCGAKLFCRELVEKVFRTPFKTSWLFDAELLMRLSRSDGRDFVLNHVWEVPVSMWKDRSGSKMKFIQGGVQLLHFLML